MARRFGGVTLRLCISKNHGGAQWALLHLVLDRTLGLMMHRVKEIYEMPDPITAGEVTIEAVLLGTAFGTQFMADTIEDYHKGIALPFVSGTLFEELVESGVSPIGGGEFTFRNHAVVRGKVVVPEKLPFSFGLDCITSLIVNDRGKKITVLPFGGNGAH